MPKGHLSQRTQIMTSRTSRNRMNAWLKPVVGALAMTACLAACSLKSDAGNSNDPQKSAAIVPGNSITSAAKAAVGMTIAGEIKKDGPSNFYFFDNPGKLRDIIQLRLTNKSTTL